MPGRKRHPVDAARERIYQRFAKIRGEVREREHGVLVAWRALFSAAARAAQAKMAPASPDERRELDQARGEFLAAVAAIDDWLPPEARDELWVFLEVNYEAFAAAIIALGQVDDGDEAGDV